MLVERARYANNETVIGVVGTFNSGCAKLEIPVANRAPDGPLAIVSPANTYPGLTIGGPGTESGEPDNYYPTGERNYARVVWNDQFQGAADAQFAKEHGLQEGLRPHRQGDLRQRHRDALRAVREEARDRDRPSKPEAWDKKASSYDAIASKIKTSGADAVFLGGIICNNGGKLIKDLRAGVGPDVTLFGPDGFTPISATIEGAGAAVGGHVHHAARDPDRPADGRRQDVRRRLHARRSARLPTRTRSTRRRPPRCCSRRSTKPTASAPMSQRTCSTSTSPTASSATSRSTRTATPRSAPSSVWQVKNGKSEFVKLITPELSFVKG